MENKDFVNKIIEGMIKKSPPKMPYYENDVKGLNGICFYLTNYPDGINSGELSDKLDVSTARIAFALNKLEDKGYISRTSNAEDKRKVNVCLTDDGWKYSEVIINNIKSKLLLITNEIGQKDVKMFFKLFTKIKEVLERDYNV